MKEFLEFVGEVIGSALVLEVAVLLAYWILVGRRKS